MGKEFLFKVILAGDGAVGKTSIRQRYMGKGFTGNYMKTIGADFASKTLQFQDHKVTFQVFDLAGQDSYVAARAAFYKGGQAALLVFDLQDEQTLLHLQQWVDDCMKYSEGLISTFFVLGNKADLVETRQVSRERAIEFCQQLATETGLPYVYLETSAKTGMNISEAFDYLTVRLLQRYNVEIDESQIKVPEGLTIIKPGETASTQNVEVSEEVQQDIDSLEQRVAVLEEAVKRKEGSSISQEEFEELKERVDNLEEKIKNLTKLVKKIITSLETQ